MVFLGLCRLIRKQLLVINSVGSRLSTQPSHGCCCVAQVPPLAEVIDLFLGGHESAPAVGRRCFSSTRLCFLCSSINNFGVFTSFILMCLPTFFLFIRLLVSLQYLLLCSCYILALSFIHSFPLCLPIQTIPFTFVCLCVYIFYSIYQVYTTKRYNSCR